MEFRAHLHVHILPNIFENYPITRKWFYSIAEQFCYGTESSIPKTEQKYSLPESIISKTEQKCSLPESIIPKTEQKYSLPESIIPKTEQKYSLPESIIPKTEQKYSLPGSIIPKMNICVLKTWTCVLSR